MQTFRQQPRRLLGGPFRFPAEVVLQVELVPGEPFGVGNEPGRTAFEGAVCVHYDDNVGRMRFNSTQEPEAFSIQVDLSDPVSLCGNVVSVTRFCSGYQQTLEFVKAYVAWLPAILHLGVVPPVTCARAGGTIGGEPYRYAYDEMRHAITPTAIEARAADLAQSLSDVEEFLLDKPGYRRIRAAAHYLHVADRLLDMPESPWEFLPEALLNLAKTLEVLFTSNTDDMRLYLAQLGYAKDEVERQFISVYYMRNKLDIAHARLHAALDERVSVPLYSFLFASVDDFRGMLVRAAGELRSGGLALPDDTDSGGLRADFDDILGRLRELGAVGLD